MPVPALPRSSLVGRALGAPPGRGEEGASVGVPLRDAPGPTDCLDPIVRPLPMPSGPGDGLGLVEGGRRLMSKV